MTTQSALPDRLDRIHRFLIECDRFKQIERRNTLADASRRETDAEHVWHLTLYALLLADEIEPKVDVLRVLQLLIVHDLVEIEAGDTFAYDDAGLSDQAGREAEAAEKLFGLLPDDLKARVHGWWREFEEGRTPEARFARSLDRLQAFAQNVASGGGSWREHGVRRERTLIRMDEALNHDRTVRSLVEALYADADRRGLWGGPDGGGVIPPADGRDDGA